MAQLIRVRIKATGQVLDMVPATAERMIVGGTATRVENMAVAPAAERAVAPAQASTSTKTKVPAVRKRA